MNRRAFLGTLADGLLAVPLAAEAQEPKVYRVGVLLQGSPPPPGSKPGPLRRALQELGYIVGRNLVLEVRWAEGKNQRFPDLAVELVALKPDVIIADSTPAAIAAARSTTTVPIVMMNVSDPVGSGLIASLAHPGGNVTGAIDFSNEVITKQLELLHTAASRATRIAVARQPCSRHRMAFSTSFGGSVRNPARKSSMQGRTARGPRAREAPHRTRSCEKDRW
jgi:putative tryptophan/tyrosine transport system substrate-binding protein